MNSSEETLFQRRFRAIFEQSSVPAQLYSAEGRILDCNSAWYRWTKLTPKDVDDLNASGYRLLTDPALIRTGVVENFNTALKGTSVQTPPIFYNLADYGLHDQTMWIQANFYPIPDETGAIAEVLILHHDVSELMEAKRAAETALAQGRTIAQSAPVAIQVYDAEGYSVFTNDMHTRIFGSPPPPGYCVLTDSLVEAAGNLHLIRKAFSGEPAVLPLFWYDPSELTNIDGADREYTQKFGRRCAIETHMVPVKDQASEVTHVVFIFKDVTAELYMKEERERALKERDDTRKLVQSVLDQTRAVIYIKDPEGRFIFANKQFGRIMSRPLEQILGKTNHELFPKAVADEFRKNDLEILRTKSHIELEEEAVHADGTKHTYLSLKFPIEDSSGSPYGTCGISTEITQFRMLERELSTAKRMEAVGLLAGGIAHNFNNILGIILLVADTLLIQDTAKDPRLKAAIGSIKSAAQSAGYLTRQLLTFGRRQKSQPRNIDLGAVVRETREILANALGEDIRFDIEAEEGLWPVHLDPMEAEQVLTNLCFNAREAMPRGGSLLIRIRNAKQAPGAAAWRIGAPAGDYVELSVSDTGTGIAPEVIDRIFEPFFTTSKDGKGTGLGLSTVYGAVQAARGDIAVDSAPGMGTRFRICLPRAQGPLAPRQAHVLPAGAIRGGTETLLFIEDQVALRNVTASLLREFGYSVIEATDVETALRSWAAAPDRIDLVICDIILPDGSGLQVLEAIAKCGPSRPLKALLTSAYSENKLSDYHFEQERHHYIEKPYSAEQLLMKVREILDSSSS